MPDPEPPEPQPGDIPCSCGWPMRWTPRGYVLMCPRCDALPAVPPGSPINGGPSL
jgi:hypothetical protein